MFRMHTSLLPAFSPAHRPLRDHARLRWMSCSKTNLGAKSSPFNVLVSTHGAGVAHSPKAIATTPTSNPSRFNSTQAKAFKPSSTTSAASIPPKKNSAHSHKNAASYSTKLSPISTHCANASAPPSAKNSTSTLTRSKTPAPNSDSIKK